jgi:hypothetical protein
MQQHFYQKAINKMNHTANNNYCANLEKIKNKETDANYVKTFLEYFVSKDMKSFFTQNQTRSIFILQRKHKIKEANDE